MYVYAFFHPFYHSLLSITIYLCAALSPHVPSCPFSFWIMLCFSSHFVSSPVLTSVLSYSSSSIDLSSPIVSFSLSTLCSPLSTPPSSLLLTLLFSQSLETEESELMGCLSYHLGTPVEAGDVARSLMKVLLRLAGHLYVDKYVLGTAFVFLLLDYS